MRRTRPACSASLATLRAVNPGAAISGAVKGSEAALPPSDGVAPRAGSPVLGRRAAPRSSRRGSLIDATIDWTAFSVWLSALLHARGDDVLRVKGVVRTPAGRLLLQSVRKVVQSPEILPPQAGRCGREDNTIVVIGRGYRGEDSGARSRISRGRQQFRHGTPRQPPP